MALQPGNSVGHYQILGSLGAGGMGEVYRARDTKLGRDVALKILPDAVSSDPERRSRFEREARALAALNHPNIAHLHGFEDGGPTSALIMELVEGEDLSDRIRRGPIPYDDALAIARQLGEALQAAHERGIIHRDLKPGNIKVRDDGTVKVLDFGLAKALDLGSGIGDQGSGDVSHSPTITSPATLRGVILGTAAYMAPEQAKGRVVDKRVDIWAFGCVLYEMLTGRKAFAGDDVSDTLASILKSDVDWAGVPPRAARLLRKCLEKDPRKRLHDIGDAWDLLDDRPAAAAAGSPRSARLPWILAALFAVTAIGVTWLWFIEPPPAPPSTARFHVAPPPKQDFGIYLSLSPDGRRLAFTTGGQPATLWIRDLESLEAKPLPGTEGAGSPFWSPDGRFIAFGDGSTLKKIDVSGGPPLKVADTGSIVGSGAWTADGVIVFGTRGIGPLYRVAATGGTPTALTSINQGERGHSFPAFLRDRKRFLYLKLSASPEVQGVYVGSIERAPAEQDPTRILALALGPLAIADSTAGERLLYMRDGTLLAQPLDADSGQLSGDAQPLADRLGSAGSFAYFAAGGDVLAFRTGATSVGNLEQLTWVGRTGETLGKVGEPLPVATGALSLEIAPNGRRAAVVVAQTISPDVWVMELDRGLATRVTFTDEPETGAAWFPDGRRVYFRSTRGGAFDQFGKDVDGTGQETPIAANPTSGIPNHWSPDGRFLLSTRGTGTNNLDVIVFSAERKAAEPLMETPFAEQWARFSPDGRWLAYTSNESGQNEIYIRAFAVSADGKASLGPKWRVSDSGGVVPRWRQDSRQLYYRKLSGEFMSVDVKATANSIETARPQQLFAPAVGVHAWDVTPDGQRFLMGIPTRNEVQAMSDPVTVVLNWKNALGR